MAERTGIQEWVRWQVITAAIFLINGGIYSMKYPYQTFAFSLPSLGPTTSFGPTNSAQFPFAEAIASSGPTIPIAGLIAIISAPAIILLEFREEFRINDMLKAIPYLLIGLVSMTQLSCVQPALYVIYTSVPLPQATSMTLGAQPTPQNEPSRINSWIYRPVIMFRINKRLLIFHTIFWGCHAALFIYGWLKQKNDYELRILNSIGTSVYVSRAAGLVMGVDCSLLLLGVCRNIIRVLRSSFLNNWIPFNQNLYFHRWTAYATLLFAILHINAHYSNFYIVQYQLGAANLGTAEEIHFGQWAGATGHVMLLICFLMFTSSKKQVKEKNFEIFWYTHHLFVPFYLCLFCHAWGCFVKSADTKICKGYNSNYGTVPFFIIYIAERFLRAYRAGLPTDLTKVIFHPGNTLELRFEKASFQYKPGQYLFLNIPSISQFQWHPFTISSTPEEGFVSVHIRIVGDWTKKTAEMLGCFQNGDKLKNAPRICIDGPYGSPAEDLYNYKVAILVGAGIGVTPAASLLKSVWYRYYRKAPMPLKKLYFFWISRDPHDFSWFQSLLSSLEDTVPKDMLEIHTYLTGNQSTEDIQNIALNQGDIDPVTELQTRCRYGRPQWARIFEGVATQCQDKSDVGVFFCGPKAVAKKLDEECRKTDLYGVKFNFHNS